MSSGLNASAQRQQETAPTPSPGAGNFDTTASTTSSTSEESESTPSTGAWETTSTGRNPIDRFVESTSWSRQDLDIALSAVNVLLFLAILYIQTHD